MLSFERRGQQREPPRRSGRTVAPRDGRMAAARMCRLDMLQHGETLCAPYWVVSGRRPIRQFAKRDECNQTSIAGAVEKIARTSSLGTAWRRLIGIILARGHRST